MDTRHKPFSMTATDDRSRAWRTYFEASERLQGALELKMKSEFNIGPSDYAILLVLWESDNYTLRMGDIAKAVVFSPSRVTYLINNLVKDGLVEKIASHVDGRGYDAVLTSQGLEVVKSVTTLHQRLVRDFLVSSLNEEDIDALVRVMLTLEENMRYRTFF